MFGSWGNHGEKQAGNPGSGQQTRCDFAAPLCEGDDSRHAAWVKGWSGRSSANRGRDDGDGRAECSWHRWRTCGTRTAGFLRCHGCEWGFVRRHDTAAGCRDDLYDAGGDCSRVCRQSDGRPRVADGVLSKRTGAAPTGRERIRQAPHATMVLTGAKWSAYRDKMNKEAKYS